MLLRQVPISGRFLWSDARDPQDDRGNEAKLMAATNSNQGNGQCRGGVQTIPYLCSKSTGAVTSCTRKYLASAGHFRATASYIA